jgi:transglutaminase-like putative cysteine protease
MKFPSFSYAAIAFFIAITENWAYSQINYASSTIPAELKTNAKAIIRLDEAAVTISSINKSSTKVHKIITILNDNGRNLSVLGLVYNRFISISNLEFTVYDVNGKKIKRIPKDEIYDLSASSYAGYEDNRGKLIDPEIRTYPFTIDYKYEINSTFLLFLPDWKPYPDYNVAIEKSIFKVISDNESAFQYFERNISNSVTITKNPEQVVYEWQVNNLHALKEEPFSKEISEYTPCVLISSKEFKYDDFVGTQKSWKDLGQWYYDLNKNRDELPLEFQSKIKSMTSYTTNDFEKVKILYTYLQKNTRYVSEQIGIGGWQTFEAERVNRLGYGDCKALTNYMMAMLKTVGIQSYATLILAGNNAPAITKDFPSSQFNHVMLFVPLNTDTLWLECTSQFSPCGYGGTFTDDRDALVIKEDGGVFIHKPAFSMDENSLFTKASITLDESGNGSGVINFKNKGEYYREAYSIMLGDNDDKKKALYEEINIPNFTIKNFNFAADSTIDPTVTETVNLDLPYYSTKMGANFIFTLNMTNKIESLPRKVENRLSDIFIRRSRIESDTIVYTIPASMTISSIPGKIEINSDFGSYTAEVIYNNGLLTYIRTIKLFKGTYPKSDYSKLVDFFTKITDADQKKIAMKPL